MNIYLENETTFTRNGLGFLTDSISAKITETLNGDMYLEIEYPLNGALSEYLSEGNIIKANTGNSNYQLFRIKRIVKTFETISVYALHITYDLKDNMLLDAYPQNLDCQTFGNWLLARTNYQHNFNFVSNISGLKSARYIRKNPIEAIMGNIDNSMINIFGGDIERDNFTIKQLSMRGNDNHVKLLFGKNITDIKITVDITSMYTRILPVGFDGLVLPEKYVDSPLISNYPTPKIGTVEFSNIKYDATGEDSEAYSDINDAYQALRDSVNALYTNGIDKPNINIKINWLELSKVQEYYQMYQNLERVSLGDKITANILGLDYTTRINKTVYNVLTDTIDNFEIGSFTSSITNTINTTTATISTMPTTILNSAKNSAESLINTAMGGYVYKTQSELFIMDTDDPNTAQKVWRWNINGLGYSSTGINGSYGIAITMDGQIVADYITTGTLNTNVIQGYDSLTTTVQDHTRAIGDRSLKTSTITQDIDNIQAEIGDIADITMYSEGTGELTFDNVNQSEPIHIEVYPTTESISYLYPNSSLYPSAALFTKNRDIVISPKPTETSEDYAEEPINGYIISSGRVYNRGTDKQIVYTTGYTNFNSSDIIRYSGNTNTSGTKAYGIYGTGTSEDDVETTGVFSMQSSGDLKLSDFPSGTTWFGFCINTGDEFTLKRVQSTIVGTVIRYTLPTDLYYYDSSNYDSFYLDYENQQCYVTHKVGLNNDGTTYVLTTPYIENITYPKINLEDGDYIVSISSVPSAYMKVRLMAQNVYTKQFATRVEVDAKINVSAGYIEQSVNRKIEGVAGEDGTITSGSIILAINGDTSSAKINADEIGIIGKNNIKLEGYTTINNGFSVDNSGNMTANNGTFNGTVNASSGTIGGWNLNSNGLTNGSLEINKNGYATIYTVADVIMMNAIIRGEITATTKMIQHYDFNGNGQVDAQDLLHLIRMIGLE